MLSAQLFTSRWRKLRPSFCYCGTKLIKVLPDHLEKDCAAFALHQQGERVPPIPPPCQACGWQFYLQNHSSLWNWVTQQKGFAEELSIVSRVQPFQNVGCSEKWEALEKQVVFQPSGPTQPPPTPKHDNRLSGPAPTHCLPCKTMLKSRRTKSIEIQFRCFKRYSDHNDICSRKQFQI